MKSKFYALLSVFVLATVILSACGGQAATATQAPAPTEPPAATQAPTSAATSAPTTAPTAAPTQCAPAVPNWDPTTADVGSSKVMTVAFEQEPDVAVGNFSNMSFGGWLYQMYGIGTGKWDDKNNLVPYAAAEIPSVDNGDISADGTTLTWKLKPCIFWSDGQPITSKDIAFTWQVYQDKTTNPVSHSDWVHVKSVDTPDDQTAVLHFDGVYPAWTVLLDIGPNNSSGSILPEHIFKGKTGLEKDPQVHTPTWAGGPFAIKEWIAGDHLTLVPNPNYFGDKPKLDAIQIKFVSDPEAGLAALQAGDVDLMVNLAESDIEAVQGMSGNGVQLRVDPTPEFEHLLFNLGTTAGTDGKGKSDVNGFCPFQDVNVRKAIAMGMDRLSFIKNYLKEDEKAFIATLWPNSSWNNTSITPIPYDPDQANQLLDAAGYAKGADGIRAGTCKEPDGTSVNVKFSLGIETTNAQRRIDDVLAIQSDLKKIGIDIKPNHLPAGTFFGSYTEGADMPLGKFDMAIFTTGYYPDPDAKGNWDCADVTSKDAPSGANNYHLCDPKMDAMWDAGLATPDIAARKKVYDQIQQYMYDNVLMVPLYARANVYAFRDNLVFPPSSGYSNAFWAAEMFDKK